MASAIAASIAAQTAQQQFQRASDEYLDKVYFPYQPTAGTLSGYHQYDTQYEDFSPKTIAAEIAALKSFEARVAAIPVAELDQVSRGDRELVLGSIRSELLTLETIRPFLAEAGIVSTGRYGGWNYSAMEDALRFGRDGAAEAQRILGGAA